MNRINDFQIDPALMAYTGKSPLQVYAKIETPRENNGRTTYSIKPIRAETRLFRWLQENSNFFNSIITFFLSIGIKKNDRCTILQNYKINPKNSIAENLNNLYQNILLLTGETSNFFSDSNKENFVKGVIQSVVEKSEISDARKLEIMFRTLSSDFHTEILEELRKHYSKIHYDVTNYFKVEEDTYKIHIYLPEVKNQPEKVLEQFYSKCYIPAPNIDKIEIFALDSEFNQLEAEDKGGPSRQFMTDLFEGLKEKSLKFASNDAGFLMPKAENGDAITESEKNFFEAIGKLMGLCLTSNGLLLTGQIFDPALFKVMVATTDDLMQMEFKDLPQDSLINLLRALRGVHFKGIFDFYDQELWNCTDTKLKIMFDFAYFADEDKIPPNLRGNPSLYKLRENFHLIKNEISNWLYAAAELETALPCIFKICQGIAKHCRKDKPWGKDPTEISNKIQGNFSKYIVIDVLDCRPGSLGYDFHTKTREYFFKWITESSTEKVQKFLKVATGSNTIAKEGGIQLNMGNNMSIDKLPIYYTCQQQIDIPEYDNYVIFKQKLEQSFGCLEEGGGFQKK